MDKKTIGQEELILEAMKQPHPKTFTPLNIITLILTGILGSIIGMETICNIGSAPNTSIVGALIAVCIGFLPFKFTSSYKNIHTQNLIETGISASTFGAANCMLYAMAVMWLLGLREYIIPMIIGTAFGLILDVTVLYWCYDTPLLRASASWPLGVATAQTLLSAAEKGKKAVLLICGAVGGATGAHFGIPTDIMGICFFGNICALVAFCIGHIIKAWLAPSVMGIDIGMLYIPHGIMLGAGVAALFQIFFIIIKKPKKNKQGKNDVKDDSKRFKCMTEEERISCDDYCIPCTRTANDLKKSIIRSYILFVVGAIIIALMSSLFTEMSVSKTIWWCIYAALAALISELMCGISSMNAGWFPGTATVLIFLVIGLFFDFPVLALGLLVGYTSSTGPAFSDMGYDFKTGWIVRGKGINPNFELEGRKEQWKSEIIGCAVAIIVTWIAYTGYFSQGRFPPVAKTFVATIEAGADHSIIKNLIVFGIIGAIIQFLGGSNRQIGILLGNGLLIGNFKAGIFGLVALAIRIYFEKAKDNRFNDKVKVIAAGMIAGNALFSFFNSTVKVIVKKKAS